MSKKVQLYGNCIPVQGASRSILCDMQTQSLHYIPNSLYQLIDEHMGKTPDAIKKAYQHQYNAIIDEYLQFLEEKDCIFYTEHPERFPKINTDWEYPHQISNAIIDQNQYSKYDVHKVLRELDQLRCKQLQLRFFDRVEEKMLSVLLDCLETLKSSITSVEILLPENTNFSKNSLVQLMQGYPRITQLCVHSASHKETIAIGSKHLIFVEHPVDAATHCGMISMNYFSINLKTFTESQHHNSCLNRKISVDTKGNIKNCPSMSKSYGNIRDTTLSTVLEHKDFKKYWIINKDQISVCKDCEFRYVCTDCRAYTENPEDLYSKPLKCGYDPYTNQWEEWSTNPLKEKAIEFYNIPIANKNPPSYKPNTNQKP